jgi:hypothetical protein
LLLLAGCTTADPNAWLLYAKANYVYGRMEAKTELLCTGPRAAHLVDFCAEAGKARDTIKALTPAIQAELAKQQPDWPRILQYVDVVFALAGKML